MQFHILDENSIPVAIMDNTLPEAIHFKNSKFQRFATGSANFFDFETDKLHVDSDKFQVGYWIVFKYKGRDQKLYISNIEEAEKDTLMQISAKSANLDLNIEKIVPPAPSTAQPITWYFNIILADTGYTIGINELSNLTRKLSWDSEEMTRRALLQSVATQFDKGELDYEEVVNSDFTTKARLVHIKKQVGEVRDDIELEYGKNIKTIKRTTNIDNMCTAVRPTTTDKDGKVTTIVNEPNWEVLDDDGNVKFFHKKGSDKIFAPIANARFGNRGTGVEGGYILHRINYENISSSEAFTRGKTYIEEYSVPEISYETEGRADVNPGDTVTIIDDGYNPPLLLYARVLDGTDSFDDPTLEGANFGNYKALESQISSDLIAKMTALAELNAPYSTTTLTTNGVQFKNSEGSTVLTARLFKGTKETVPDSFIWKKDNTVLDNTTNILTVNASDVDEKAVYRWEAVISGTSVAFDEVTITDVSDGTKIHTTPTQPINAKEDEVWLKPVDDSQDSQIFVNKKDENGQLVWVQQGSTETKQSVKELIGDVEKLATEAKTSAQDAVDKANANVAAIQANTQLINDVNTVANHAKNQAQTATNNAQTALTNAGTAMINAQTALDNYNNLTIGGRNFLLGTADPVVMVGNGGTNQIPKNIWFPKSTLADLDISVGDSLYFSVDIEISGSNFAGTFMPRLGNTRWTHLTPTTNDYAITKSEKIKWRIPLTALNDSWIGNSRVDFRLDNVPSTVTITASYMKLERGNKYSDWSQAPEDTIVEITNISGQLSQKVSQTAFDTLNGTVTNQATQINQNKNDILQKASITDVNTLTGRVTTAEGSMSTMAGQIALKANQTDVNTITGKISSLESSFTIQSGQISALNTKTDGHTTQIGSLQSSYSGLQSTISKVQDDISNSDPKNLVINSTFNLGYVGWTASAGTFQDSSVNTKILPPESDKPNSYIATTSYSKNGRYYIYSDVIPYEANKDITISFDVRISNASDTDKQLAKFVIWNGTTALYAGRFLITEFSLSDNAFKTVYKTFNTGNYANATGMTIELNSVTGNTGADNTSRLDFREVMMTIGNKVYLWQSAPSDLATVSQFSQMSQELESFKTTVSNTYLTKTDATNTYPTKTTVASQISQSASEVRQDIQTWTNGQLTDYSTIQSTSNSIALAVADKVTQAQFTVLSNQITSVVSDLTIGGRNYLLGTDVPLVVSGKNIIDQGSSLVYFSKATIEDLGIAVGDTLYFTVDIKIAGSNLAGTFIPYISNPIRNAITKTYTISKEETIRISAPITITDSWLKCKYVFFRLDNVPSTVTLTMTEMKLEKGTKATDWSLAPEDMATQSQMTQLVDDINFRIVEKGTVTTQLNLESGRVLIDTNQLLLSASTVKFSGSAFIPNAMIQSITADKITAGTINAANVNIINLNAANITTGTLTGANLSMNLNTGEVLFQKGAIRKTDGNFVIDITNGEISSDDSTGGFSLKSGVLKLRRKADNAEYGSINYGVDNDGEWNLGLTIVGNKGYMFKTQNFTSSLSGTRAIVGSGIRANTTTNLTKIYLESQNGVLLYGGNTFDSSTIGIVPYLSIGDTSSDIRGSAKNIKFYSSTGNTQSSFEMSPEKIDVYSTQTIIRGNLNVMGTKNAVHATRDGIRATPAYETAESYLGDIGSNYTREDCEVWIDIEKLFSDTVNTDIAYHVFLQAYDDARFWVADFKSDKFLIKSDKPMSRFAWEIKAKRRGYENDRLVLQNDMDNKKIEDAWRKSA